jgi:hypothetical protein
VTGPPTAVLHHCIQPEHRACLPPHSLQYSLSQHEGEDEYDCDDSEEGQQRPVGRRGRRGAGFAAPAPAEELKMVLVVNDELKMGKGKIGGWLGWALVGKLGGTAAVAITWLHWLPAQPPLLSQLWLHAPVCLLPLLLHACRRAVRARGSGSGGAAARCTAGCGAGAVGALRPAQDLPQGQLHPGESASQ